MDIIKVKNTSYTRYEEVLLKRDGLRKEAEQYRLAYYSAFGDLITRTFEKKIECIRKKKMIAYCQRQVNMGRRINPGSLDRYIEQEMKQYSDDLQGLIGEVKAAKEGGNISEQDLETIRKTYYELVRMIHPDLHPELVDDEVIKDYWHRIKIAYTYNQLTEIEELKMMVALHLDRKGSQITEIHVSCIEDRISAVEKEIEEIISTNPYLYKELLHNQEEVMRRKQEYEDEAASYEIYSVQLDEVLSGFQIERKLS